MRRFVLVGLSASLLFLGACAEREATVSNDEVEDMIETRYDADMELKDSDIDIDVDMEKNQVTLKGDVPTDALKMRAAEIAQQARPGLSVVNQLEVEPRELTRDQYTEDMAGETRLKAKEAGTKIGDSIEDAWIHTKLVSKLIVGDPPQHQINVDVMNNNVVLRGSVDTAEEKAEAERIAKETEGVKSVKNQLKVERK